MNALDRAAHVGLAAAAVLLIGLATGLPARAQDQPPRRHKVAASRADAHPLTVRPRAGLVSGEPIVAEDGFYDGVGIFRRWDDPRLYSFYGWRLGGDNFYGDQAGDPGTRGNAGLGAIAGYGPARGGYGGPHFDSVGGFHNGPGPGAQEAADYATGSISTPRYDRPVPRYPTLKAQVAGLDTGIAGTGQVTRVKARLPQDDEDRSDDDDDRPGPLFGDIDLGDF